MGANERGLLQNPGAGALPPAPEPDTIVLPPAGVRSGAAAAAPKPGARTRGPFVVAAAAPAPAATRLLDGKLALGALLGLLGGAAAGYLAATAVYGERLDAASQASDLRLAAANQRIQELQEQQRAFAEQADKQQQEIVAQADAQQRRILSEVGAQEHAMLAQQRTQDEQAREHERTLAQQREAELARPDLPVKVWTRKAPLLGGLVGQIHSYGTKDISVMVTLQSAKTGEQTSWSTIVVPNTTVAIGKDPGWRVAKGDFIHVSADGFRPVDLVVGSNPAAAQK